MTDFKALAAEVGELVTTKNEKYGNSFGKAGEFLRLLYPNGVPPEAYTDLLLVVRVFDKLMRIATAKGSLGESEWQDLMGYALLGLAKDREGEPHDVETLPQEGALHEADNPRCLCNATHATNTASYYCPQHGITSKGVIEWWRENVVRAKP